MSRATRARAALSTREGRRIELRYAQSARQLFPELADRSAKSRPVIGERVVHIAGDTRTTTTPVYGKPTFRNRIVGGEHL